MYNVVSSCLLLFVAVSILKSFICKLIGCVKTWNRRVNFEHRSHKIGCKSILQRIHIAYILHSSMCWEPSRTNESATGPTICNKKATVVYVFFAKRICYSLHFMTSLYIPIFSNTINGNILESSFCRWFFFF